MIIENLARCLRTPGGFGHWTLLPSCSNSKGVYGSVRLKHGLTPRIRFYVSDGPLFRLYEERTHNQVVGRNDRYLTWRLPEDPSAIKPPEFLKQWRHMRELAPSLEWAQVRHLAKNLVNDN